MLEVYSTSLPMVVRVVGAFGKVREGGVAEVSGKALPDQN